MRNTLIALVLLLPLVFGFSNAEGAMSKTVDGLTVNLTLNMDMLTMGDNHAAITITNSSGKEVTNARVKVDYGMPTMKNMAPMEYVGRAKYKDGAYKSMLNIIMEGTWFLNVKVLLPGKDVVTASFDFKVGEGSGQHKMDSNKMGHDK